MIKLVWDTSALINIKDANGQGYSPAASLWKDLADGWIPGPYQNIIPAIAAFEIEATISRKHREGDAVLREFYLMGDTEVLYPIDQNFLYASNAITAESGFNLLRGADLIFACVAKLENAWLVTLDDDYQKVKDQITVLDLRDSLKSANYRRHFKMLGD